MKDFETAMFIGALALLIIGCIGLLGMLSDLVENLSKLRSAYEELAKITVKRDRSIKFLEYQNAFLRADLETTKKNRINSNS